MILLPKAAVDRNAQLDAGEVDGLKVWLMMRSQEIIFGRKIHFQSLLGSDFY